MPSLVFVLADGTRRHHDIRAGQSIMECAIRGGIPGIVAECGGSGMCATCHVMVEGEKIALLPTMSDEEDVMLNEVNGMRAANSRLSCQLRMTEELDGLIVRVGENGF